MIILNTVKEKCKGVWTRVQGEEKSIIDYVLTDASSANTVKEMKIDEGKKYGLYTWTRQKYSNQWKYTKIIILHWLYLDFETPTEEKRPKKIITKKDIKDTEQS